LAEAGLKELLAELQGGVSERMWGAAVQYARTGAVVGLTDDGEEAHLHVKTPARALPYEVFLWPSDPDYDCDCGKGEACVHIVAAAIALRKTQTTGGVLPEPTTTQKVSLRYDFVSANATLAVSRTVVRFDGSTSPLMMPLKRANLLVGRTDVQAESLLALQQPGPLKADVLRRLLVILDGYSSATLDDQPIRIDAGPVSFRVRVLDHGDGFKLGLFRPGGIDALFRGAARVGDVLRPTSHGDLNPEQRRMLMQGVIYGPDEVAVLVSEAIPKLRQRIPVEIATERLPEADALVPRVAVTLRERATGLEVKAQVVYGDPAVAVVGPGGSLKRLSEDIVPARDLPAERMVQRAFEARLGRPVGFTHLLQPEQAVQFLATQLPLHDGPIKGRVDPERFRVVDVDVVPRLEVERTEDAGWRLDVQFGEDEFEADPLAVLQAWRGGRSLVPLMDGGWAPLPIDWLKQHGALLQELLDARDGSGRVDRNATAALVELLEDTKGEVPADLSRLRSFLSGDQGLPEVELPHGFVAELRGYQHAGLEWLCFLRDLGLNGILADDMGLGKTVMGLGVLCATPGPHLVVAPTSVLRNWANEAARFTPNLSVNVYHGPSRVLDDSDIVLTSYALLRIDLALLLEREWGYVVLDEAQAIKNSSSQTARSAVKLRSRHRVCLTGTPIENRLEELWSLFRFLMPGLLGSERSFKDSFARPIEDGDERARQRLRARVRPYVLRRLKRQVAAELPSLTDIVVRCHLGEAQRKVYNTVRIAARREVREALAERGRAATLQVLEALLRMRQACCDPSLLPGQEDSAVPSSKLDRLEELLVELVAEDHKALVFSQWTSLLDRVEPRLRELGIDWVRLDGSTRDRQAVIDAFQSDEGPPVFLLSLKAGGTGLNLTAADYVIHLDPWWNPAVQQQATDRAHRIGQHRPVVSCRLVAEDTVEERILALQDAKRGLADAALGTDGGFVKSLSVDELRALFEPPTD
jgi:superfamily II DNA or RNA helicase